MRESTLTVNNYAFKVEGPSDANSELFRYEENVLFAREALEDMKRHIEATPAAKRHFEDLGYPQWQAYIHVLADSLGDHYSVPSEDIMQAWMRHTLPGELAKYLEKEKE